MTPETIKGWAAAFGISLGTAVVIFGVVGGFIAYRNYLESVSIKLDIKQKMKELGIQETKLQKILIQ